MTVDSSTDAICYFIYEKSSQREIDIKDAVAVSLERAADLLFCLKPEQGNFIGFVTAYGQVMQFMSLGQADQYLIDIPIPDKGGSFQKIANFEECHVALTSLFRSDGGFEIVNMIFKAWK